MNYGPYISSGDQSLDIPSPHNEGGVLPPETIEVLEELGMIFRRTHERMISEGYTLVGGKVVKLDVTTQNDNDRPDRKSAI